MISIGIDVHKIKCVATIKHESKEKLEQTNGLTPVWRLGKS